MLTQDDIAKKLRELGYSPKRKDKDGNYKERSADERKSIGKDLKLLYDLGYNIHGVEPELDEDGNELPKTRGKIWLEKDISDEKLKLLIDSVLFSNYIGSI